VVGYKDSSTLELQASGLGGVAELVSQLKDTEVQFALLRMPITSDEDDLSKSLISRYCSSFSSEAVQYTQLMLGLLSPLLGCFPPISPTEISSLDGSDPRWASCRRGERRLTWAKSRSS